MTARGRAFESRASAEYMRELLDVNVLAVMRLTQHAALAIVVARSRLCFSRRTMPRPHETLQVSDQRWRDAQTFESGVWAGSNRRNGLLKLAKKWITAMARPRQFARLVRYRDFYCGDDWNYWWLDAFEGYRMLPGAVEQALEVGSGPYSNVRLIAHTVRIGHITCADPLMDEYRSYRRTWVASQARRGRITTATCMAESMPFPDAGFDLVVCINVLDHVRDGPRCFEEMRRVLRPGGHLVLGQDLSDARDVETMGDDVGHPIRLDHATLDEAIAVDYSPVFHRVLPRDAGRSPAAHYGTYLYVGVRR